jgi:hypothetical protein
LLPSFLDCAFQIYSEEVLEYANSTWVMKHDCFDPGFAPRGNGDRALVQTDRSIAHQVVLPYYFFMLLITCCLYSMPPAAGDQRPPTILFAIYSCPHHHRRALQSLRESCRWLYSWLWCWPFCGCCCRCLYRSFRCLCPILRCA